MIKVLKACFGEARQSDKSKLKSRRRRPNETLRNLHSDIRRLAALALPELDHGARETMACDYFIDALDDPNFALKVRERSPKDLVSALRVARQLEVWSRDLEQSSRRERNAREITEPEKKDKQTAVLKKQVAELQKQLTELQKKDQIIVLSRRVDDLEAQLTEAKSFTATAPAPAHALASKTPLHHEQLQERLDSERGSTFRQVKAPVGDAELPGIGSEPARRSPMLKKESTTDARSARLASTPVPYALSTSRKQDRYQRSSTPVAM